MCPRIKPKVLQGRDPQMPVFKNCAPSSGVNIVLVVEQRSNPGLFFVALQRSEIDFGLLSDIGFGSLLRG